MKMLMLPVAIGVMLATSSAWSQDYRSDDRSAYRSDYRDGERGGRGEMRERMRGGQRDTDADRYADGYGQDASRYGESGQGESRGRGERSRGGAGFWMTSGELSLGAKCPPGESMRSCVDAALVLLDRARSTPAATPNGAVPAPQANPPR